MCYNNRQGSASRTLYRIMYISYTMTWQGMRPQVEAS